MSPASSTPFGIGIAAIVVGAAAIAIGGLGVLANSFSDDPKGSSGNGAPNLAIGVLVGGLAVEGGGIALVVLNASSRVHQTTAFGPSARPLLRLTF